MSIPRTIRVKRNNPCEPGRECRAFSPGHVMSRAFVLAATDRIIVGCNDTLEGRGNVWSWHLTKVPSAPANVCYRDKRPHATDAPPRWLLTLSGHPSLTTEALGPAGAKCSAFGHPAAITPHHVSGRDWRNSGWQNVLVQM